MENISPMELGVIRKLVTGGRGIKVIAHCPQKKGGCHSFEFLRGVLPNETDDATFKRVAPDVLQHIESSCGRACTCNDGKPVVSYRRY